MASKERIIVRVSYAIVFVKDMGQAVSFYRDILGLPIKFQSPEWTEFATDGATLALHVSNETVPRDGYPAQNLPGRCRPGLSVKNLTEFHQRMVGQNVLCTQKPKDIHGTRLAEYLDPDGLAFSVSEEK